MNECIAEGATSNVKDFTRKRSCVPLSTYLSGSGMKPARIGPFWNANVGLPYTEKYRKLYENIKNDTSRFTAGQLTALRCVLLCAFVLALGS